MTARCRFTRLDEIKDVSTRSHVAHSVHLTEIGLDAGRHYPVEGLFFREGIAWFYICDEADAEYPTPYCSAFFDLLDPRIPTGWKLSSINPGEIVPAEWAEFPQFYEKLLEGDSGAVALFDQIRQSKT